MLGKAFRPAAPTGEGRGAYFNLEVVEVASLHSSSPSL